MKKQWINKSLRIILFTGIGAAVIGTFYFLWKKSQPVVTVYEVVSPSASTTMVTNEEVAMEIVEMISFSMVPASAPTISLAFIAHGIFILIRFPVINAR